MPAGDGDLDRAADRVLALDLGEVGFVIGARDVRGAARRSLRKEMQLSAEEPVGLVE